MKTLAVGLICRRAAIWSGALCGFYLLFLGLSGTVFAQTTQVNIGVGDTSLVVRGHTSPASLVTILDNGSVIGSTLSDNSGAYSQTFTAQSPGIHTLKVYVQDQAGRTSDPATVQVNVTEHAQTIIDLFLPPTIEIENTVAQQGGAVFLQGEARPGADVIIYLQTSHVRTGVDASGRWQYSLPTGGIAPGQYELYVIAQSGGSQSYPTASHFFTVTADSGSPAEPSLPDSGGGFQPQPQPDAPRQTKPKSPIIDQPKSGTSTGDSSIPVIGTAGPGTRVEIWNNDKLTGSVFVDEFGNWSIIVQLTEGVNNLKSRACKGDMCSDFSKPVTVFRQPQFGQDLTLWLDDYNLKTVVGMRATLSAHIEGGTAPYTVITDWGDGNSANFQTTEYAEHIKHEFNRAGNYNGRITVKDAKNREVTAQFTVTVSPDAVIPVQVIVMLAVVVVVFLLFTARNARLRKTLHRYWPWRKLR